MAVKTPTCVKGTSIISMTISKRDTALNTAAIQEVLAEKGYASIHIPPAHAAEENEPGLQRVDIIGDVTEEELKSYLAAILEQAAENLHADNLKRREQEAEFGHELMAPIWAEEDAELALDEAQKRSFMEIEDEGRAQMREAASEPGMQQEAALERG